MEIKFKQSGEGEIGKFKKGDIKSVDSKVAKIYISRGIAEEIKTAKEPKKREVIDNGGK